MKYFLASNLQLYFYYKKRRNEGESKKNNSFDLFSFHYYFFTLCSPFIQPVWRYSQELLFLNCSGIYDYDFRACHYVFAWLCLNWNRRIYKEKISKKNVLSLFLLEESIRRSLDSNVKVGNLLRPEPHRVKRCTSPFEHPLILFVFHAVPTLS